VIKVITKSAPAISAVFLVELTYALFVWWIGEARLISCLMASALLASSDGAAVSHLMLPNPPPNTRPVEAVIWPSGNNYSVAILT
jgi:hypothetical protein